MERVVFHVDMDAFYAAVEQCDRPELKGRPVLVGGSADRRGVICAASYEARPFGCRSAMSTATALRLCPDAILLPVRMARYQEVSRRIFRIFDEFSPEVEPLSVDEAFLDLTGTGGLWATPVVAAMELKARIRSETGLTASIGVAPNKFLAKLLSDLRKPDGLVEAPADTLQEFLDPLPASRIWGVGPATLQRLNALGVQTFRDVRLLPQEALVRSLGPAALRLQALARGEDQRPVTPDRQAKSISHECTFPQDVDDPDHLRATLLHQTEDVAYRLRRAGLSARSVSLKLRLPSFATHSRSGMLAEPSDTTSALWNAAAGLFDAWIAERPEPLRLLGMGAGELLPTSAVQRGLFEEEHEGRDRRLDAALDQLRGRFGPGAVRRAGPGTPPHRERE